MCIVDPTDGGETWTHQKNGFNYATDMVNLIKQEHGDHFNICVAGTNFILVLYEYYLERGWYNIDISPGVWYDTDISPCAIIVEMKLPYRI